MTTDSTKAMTLEQVIATLEARDLFAEASFIKAHLAPREVPAMHRDHLKPEYAERYYVTQEEIDATHPMNTHCDTCPADNVAMILVGERHEKRNLVDLVRTLLLKAEAHNAPREVVSDEDVERAIDAYERAPGVMQHTAMRAALQADRQRGGRDGAV